jgi:hypothetical protein
MNAASTCACWIESTAPPSAAALKRYTKKKAERKDSFPIVPVIRIRKDRAWLALNKLNFIAFILAQSFDRKIKKISCKDLHLDVQKPTA